MERRRTREPAAGILGPERRAFTLIELLVVIAIIALLLGILMPTLAGARHRAKNVKTRASLKSINDGAEMYRNDNESDRTARQTGGYPPSRMAPDPHVEGNPEIAGANWLVLHLMGKDLNGYAPPRNAPPDLPPEEWYDFEADGTPKVDRVGPYLPGMPVVRTRDLPQGPGNPALNREQEEHVLVDTFGFPILYYVTDTLQSQKRGAYIATYGTPGSEPGIYNFRDNGLFTGQCRGMVCTLPGWDFGDGGLHHIENFGEHDPPDPAEIAGDTRTFPYYILDKDLYFASIDSEDPTNSNFTAVPHRRDSFLLITAGKDGLFGTSDDVRNF